MIKCIQEVSKQLINQNPEMRGIKNSIKAGSQKQQHFWLRQELKVSQCVFVCLFGTSLSKTMNLSLRGLCQQVSLSSFEQTEPKILRLVCENKKRDNIK